MRNKDLISDEFNQKISFLNNNKFNKFKPSFAKLNVDVNKENTYQTRPISYQQMRQDRINDDDSIYSNEISSNRGIPSQQANFVFRKKTQETQSSNKKSEKKIFNDDKNPNRKQLLSGFINNQNQTNAKEQQINEFACQFKQKLKQDTILLKSIQLPKTSELLQPKEETQKNQLNNLNNLYQSKSLHQKIQKQSDKKKQEQNIKLIDLSIENCLENLQKFKICNQDNDSYNKNYSYSQGNSVEKKTQLVFQSKQNKETSDFNIYARLDDNKKEQQQEFTSDFLIPKTYLNIKGITKRTQSEKSLQLEEIKKPSERFQSQQSQQQIYYISSIISAFQSFNENKINDQVKNHFQAFLKGAKIASSCQLQSIMIVLPKLTKNIKTLVFDLDETLIHCNLNSNIPGDVLLPVLFEDGQKMEASINIRPYTFHLLQSLYKHFEIIVFTASHSSYANVIIDYLDPEKKYISHRFFRENCIPTNEGAYIKDLRVIGNRSLSNILLMDNEACSFAYQWKNAVPILPYYDNKKDEEFKHLLNYLMKFKNCEDVREINNQVLKLDRLQNYNTCMEALQYEFAALFD